MLQFVTPKTKKFVTCVLATEEILRGYLFLGLSGPLCPGSERVIDVLTDVLPFIPFESEDGKFFILNKEHIKHITVPDEVFPAELEGLKVDEIEVEGITDAPIKGRVILETPMYRSRVIDFLNSLKSDFFRIYMDGCASYINKRLIRKVRLG